MGKGAQKWLVMHAIHTLVANKIKLRGCSCIGMFEFVERKVAIEGTMRAGLIG